MESLSARHGTGTQARHGTARAVPCRAEIKNLKRHGGTCRRAGKILCRDGTPAQQNILKFEQFKAAISAIFTEFIKIL